MALHRRVVLQKAVEKAVFLANEAKPGTPIFKNVVQPHVLSDPEPAYVWGDLRRISKDAKAFSLVKLGDQGDKGLIPIFGYLITVNTVGLYLLDRMFGYNGIDGLDYHVRVPIQAYTDTSCVMGCYTWQLSDKLISGSRRQLLPVKDGCWDDKDRFLTMFRDALHGDI